MAKEADIHQQREAGLYSVQGNDPLSSLIDLSGYTEKDLAQINSIMAALGNLRDVEQKLSEASQKYMKLGKNDMRALHYLIVAKNTGKPVTPSMLAAHLGISTASTTKLLDRLEEGNHIERAPHPEDRRALTITVTEETKNSATETVGRLQSKRFTAAASLSSNEREAVTKFLTEMAQLIDPGTQDWSRGEDPR